MKSLLCSCTIPHKEATLKCCDEVDPVAKVIEASHNPFDEVYPITVSDEVLSVLLI